VNDLIKILIKQVEQIENKNEKEYERGKIFKIFYKKKFFFFLLVQKIFKFHIEDIEVGTKI